MSQTLADLSIKVDTTDLDKAQDKLKRVGEEAKKVAGGVNEAEGAFSKLKGSAGLALTGLIAVAGAAAAVYEKLSAMRDASIEAGDKMNDLSHRTNIATERLSLLDAMAKMAGSSADELVQSSEKLAMKLSKQDENSGRAVNALKQLGIATKGANGETKSMLALQEEIVMAVEKATDKAKAEGAAVLLLGTEYYKLKTPIKEAAESHSQMYDYMLKTNALISGNLAKNSDDYKDKVSKLSLAFSGIGNSIAEATLPSMIRFQEKMIQIAEYAADVIRRFAGLTSASEQTGAALGKLVNDRDNLVKAFQKVEGTAYADTAQGAKFLADSKTKIAAINDQIREMSRLKTGADAAAEATKKAVTEGAKGEGIKPQGRPAKPVKVETEKESPYAGLLLTEDKAISRLVQDYGELNDVKKATYAAEMTLILSSEKYSSKLSTTEKETLKSRAAARDYMEALISVTRAQKSADDAIAKAAQSSKDEIETNRIRLRIKKDLTKTTDDERIAVAKYNVSVAQEALNTDISNKAEESKLIKLREELAIRKQLLNTAETIGADNKAAASKTFADGWTDAFARYKLDATDASKLGADVFGKTTDLLTSGITTFIETGKLGFKDFALGFLKMIEQILVKWAVLNALSYAFGGGPVPLSAMFGVKQEKGGAWQGGMQMFADGGVVTSPTAFGMAGGQMGLMGEAGPEAIMPLKRGSDGKLGVAMSGGGNGGGGVVQQNNITVSIGSVDSTERSKELQKAIQDTIVATTRKEIAGQMRKGGMLNPVR